MRTPNHIYEPYGAEKIALLAKNYKFSDDIAFRFSSRNWEHYPLTPQKYASWINQQSQKGDILNLFMDYETFGEHQKEETGIFDFLRELPSEILKNPENEFITPTEAILKYKKRDRIDIPYLISWADKERDLSAWLGNKMQKEAIREVFELEEKVKQTKNKEIIQAWRHFTTSDHYYYMSTKKSEEGIIHNYFSIYESPYDAYVYFMNSLNDLIVRIKLFEERQNTQRDMLKEPKKSSFFNDIKQAIKG
jgi:alpha-amylase